MGMLSERTASSTGARATSPYLSARQDAAHLDGSSQQAINERLRNLKITRISVAHRPEMMSGADTMLWIGAEARQAQAAAAE